MNSYADFDWVTRSELDRLSLKESPWNDYLKTQVRFNGPERTGVVRPVEDAGCDDAPWAPLHVISATQPGSDPAGAENARRLAVLNREIEKMGLQSMRAVGSSFSGDYAEESRAVFGLDDAGARELGVRFGQVAIFSWSGPVWSLLACTNERASHRPWQWIGPPAK